MSNLINHYKLPTGQKGKIMATIVSQKAIVFTHEENPPLWELPTQIEIYDEAMSRYQTHDSRDALEGYGFRIVPARKGSTYVVVPPDQARMTVEVDRWTNIFLGDVPIFHLDNNRGSRGDVLTFYPS